MTNEQQTEFVRRRYNRNARFWDRIEHGNKITALRRLVTGRATGKVLEVGAGTGKNLPLYQPTTTTELTAIDLSPAMLERAKSKPCAVPVNLVEMDAQQLHFPDASFDTVLTTFVFCTVPDPVLGLQEVRRVCKPGGRILLLEHVRSDGPVLGALMNLLDPLVVRLVGSHINRDTVANCRLAGLTVERVESLGWPIKLIEARP